MAAKYKRSYRIDSAWNYQKEIEDLDRASEQGWQLVRGGCFVVDTPVVGVYDGLYRPVAVILLDSCGK